MFFALDQKAMSDLSAQRRAILSSLDVVSHDELSDASLISALEDETRLLEGKMCIITSLQQRKNEEEVTALMRRLAEFQMEDSTNRFRFSSSLARRVRAARRQACAINTGAPQTAPSATTTVASTPLTNPTTEPGPTLKETETETETDPEDLALLRLIAAHEQELRHISAARSKCIQEENNASIVQLLSERRTSALEVDSLLDYYFTELVQLCEASRRTFAPLFSKASHKLRALSERQDPVQGQGQGQGQGPEGSDGIWEEGGSALPLPPLPSLFAFPSATSSSSAAGLGQTYRILSTALRAREGEQLDALLQRTKDLGQGVVGARLAASTRELQENRRGPTL